MAFRIIFFSIIIGLVSLAIWFFTNDFIPEESRIIHPDSYVAPGFENVKKVFE